MGIYRGPGGTGDAVNDASSEALITVQAKDAALAAQAAAEAAQAAAELAETNAETAETNAETAETNAETAATNAANSASAASTSASNAASSASAASTSASNASTSATNAANSASAASTSASNAAASASTATTQATNASNSASAASTSATNASNSASAAATSATNAANSATAAQTAQTAAELAETNAETAETNAETAETNAAASASAAATSATNASNSASAASTSATNASNSASAAATSATNASNSASAAATSATNASNSASAAATSASDAAASYDSFDDRYLGAKSSAPTLDNDGNTLLVGALYFNTTTNEMKVWSGSTWLNAYASLSGALLATNNLSDLNNTATARTNLGVAIGVNVQAYDADLTTLGAGGSAARSFLGLAIGTDVQAYDAQLADIAGLTPTDNNFIVGNGTNFVTESGSTARTSLGLGSIATQDANNVAVTGGSINGTTVGASTASSGAFTTLSASGVTTVQAGTVSAPAITTSGDTNTGIYFPAADTIAFTEGGVESGRFTSTGALQLNNNLTFTGTGQRITGDFTSALSTRVLTQTSTVDNPTNFGIIPNGTSSQCLFSAFNNSTPANSSVGQLFVSSTEISVRSAIAGTGTYLPLAMYTGGSERLRINAIGDVAIGTSANAGDTLRYVDIQNTNTGSSAGAIIRLITSNAAASGNTTVDLVKYRTGGFYINNNDTNAAVFTAFSVGASERMRIDSSGNVGIGTTTPSGRMTVSESNRILDGVGNFNVFTTNSQAANFGGQIALGGVNGSAGAFDPWSFATLKGAKENSTSGNLAGYFALATATSGGTLSERMRIDSSGNVGIGTSSPNIASGFTNLVVSDTDNGGIIYVDRAGGARGYFYANGTSSVVLGNTTSIPLVFNTADTERMRIDSGGNVTIRANGVLSHLFTYNENGGEINLYDDAGVGATLLDQSNNQTRLLELINGSNMLVGTGAANTTGVLQFVTQNAERMRIDSSGNVGIGTSSPSQKFVVSQGTKATTASAITTVGFSTTDASSFGLFFRQKTDASSANRWSGIQSFDNGVGASSLILQDLGGSVAIGMVASGDTFLEVYGSEAATAYKNVNTGTGLNDGFYVGMGKSSATEAYVYNRENNNLIFGTNNAERMRITSGGALLVGITAPSGNAALLEVRRASGNIAYLFDSVGTGVYLAAGNNSWTAASDERIKDIIEPINNAAEKVSTLRAVIGKYKTDSENTRRSFLIAQDVQAVFPEAVNANNPEELGLQYTDIIPLLVAAIKEQQAMIENLQAEVALLKSK